MSESQLNIVLVGNPNCGKTTVFNHLTGQHQKVSNLPGTTVEEKSGNFRLESGQKVNITDLPGTYSMWPKSEDERLAASEIQRRIKENQVDLVVYVVDAGNIRRNLLLYTQIADLGVPIVLVLNTINRTPKDNIIDENLLSQELGVLVCSMNTFSFSELRRLKSTFEKSHQAYHKTFFPEDVSNSESSVEKRYAQIDEILKKSKHKPEKRSTRITDRLDKILTHRFWGFFIFFLLLLLIFQSVFNLAEYPMRWIEFGFDQLSQLARALLPDGIVQSILAEGILPGLAGIMVFLPQIAILFFLLSLLEESGYMTRAGFIMDKLMRKLGLNGKSVIPMISAMACAIPSIMAARNIENKRERLITMMIVPLMSCSARLPVYVLLISLIVPEGTYYGPFNAKGLLMMGMYLLGILGAIFASVVFNRLLKYRESGFFIYELPPFRLPRWENIWTVVVSKSSAFVLEAGKIIIIISMVLWFLASYGPGNSFAEIDQKYQTIALNDGHSVNHYSTEIGAEKLKASYAGHLGRFIEPVIRPLGYDWKIGIALITSFAAREVFVGTMNTIYSIGDDENTLKLSEKMSMEINSNTGKKAYSLATAVSLLIFYAFAMQCTSTLAIMYRETKTWKWPAVQFVFMTGMAYISAMIAYQVLS